jgi:hypothetical protein
MDKRLLRKASSETKVSRIGTSRQAKTVPAQPVINEYLVSELETLQVLESNGGD